MRHPLLSQDRFLFAMTTVIAAGALLLFARRSWTGRRCPCRCTRPFCW
ncbi:hypothetical protein MRBLMF1_001901 [Streptomyces ossamyceticus]